LEVVQTILHPKLLPSLSNSEQEPVSHTDQLDLTLDPAKNPDFHSDPPQKPQKPDSRLERVKLRSLKVNRLKNRMTSQRKKAVLDFLLVQKNLTLKNKKPPSGFFGSSDTNKSSDEKSGFSGTFGKAIEKNTSTGFVFGSKPEESTNSSTTSGFSFGNTGTATGNTGSGFTFGSSNGEAASKSGFTFGTAPSSGFSFATSGVAASQEKKEEAAAEEDDEPPKVEVTQVVEEDAFHTVRCKLFYKKEKEFVEKGLGMLHLKKVEGDTKTQMVVRAETNLGNILLNILVSDKMNVIKRKNNLQFVCVPNPPIKGVEGPVIMLAKVKDSLMADQLEAKLEEAIKAT